MTTLYKLTDKDGYTSNKTLWLPVGTEHTASGDGKLCGPGWLHAYTHPLLAILLNPSHSNLLPETMRLFEAEGDVGKTDRGLKVGCTRLRTVMEIEKPAVTTVNSVAFGILCSLELHQTAIYKVWAAAWLDGKDRTVKTVGWAEAAWAAAWAERAAATAEVGRSIDLIALAEKAITIN